MSRISLISALPLLGSLLACAEAAPSDPCSPGEAITWYGVSVQVLLDDAWLEGDTLRSETLPLECAPYTAVAAESSWQDAGYAPDSFDLAPGTYVFEASWEEDGVLYGSEPLVVDHQQGGSLVELALCADLSGPWTCGEGEATWTLEASHASACSVSFEELDLHARVRGERFEGEGLEGYLASPHELALWSDLVDGEPTRCWRDLS